MPVRYAGQETAVIASQSAAHQVDGDLRRLLKKELDTTSKTQPGKTNLDWIMNQDNLNSDKMLLARAASALASLGVAQETVKTENVLRRVQDEYFESRGKEDSKDSAEISKGSGLFAGIKKKSGGKKFGSFGQGGGFGEEADLEPKLKNEYLQKYIRSLTASNPAEKGSLKRQILELQAQLKNLGISPEQLHSLNLQLRAAARMEIAKAIKDAFLDRLTTPSKTLEWSLKSKHLNSVLDFAFNNQELGGWDFGGTTLQEVTDKLRAEATLQMQSSVLDELEGELIRDTLKSRHKKFKDSLEVFKLASQLGVDLESWQSKFVEKLQHLGVIGGVPENLDGQSSNSQQHRNQQAQDEKIAELALEADQQFLMDEVRNIYTERYLKNDLKTTFFTAFRLRAVSAKLKEMGFDQQFLNEIKVQAKKVAGLKLIASLRDAYLERVVLLPESGARVRLTSKKINKLTQRALELGVEISDEDIEKIREESEKIVYQNALAKVLTLQSILKSGQNKEAEKDLNQLLKLARRIESIWDYRERVGKVRSRKSSLLSSIFQKITQFRYINQKV